MANGNEAKLILSDSDGVIVDSFALLYRNMAKLYKIRANKDLSDADYRALFAGNALANVLKGIGAAGQDGFTAEDKAIVFAGYTDLAPFAGIVDVYEKLAAKHTLAIITSTSLEYAAAVMEKAGLSDAIAAFLGPEVAVSKHERIRLAMEQFETPADRTWYITDTTGDIIEAKSAGVKTLAVTWGFHTEADLRAAAPDAIAHTPQELADLLLA